jgi:hypothetical protein
LYKSKTSGFSKDRSKQRLGIGETLVEEYVSKQLRFAFFFTPAPAQCDGNTARTLRKLMTAATSGLLQSFPD